jgi:hypothetical protein
MFWPSMTQRPELNDISRMARRHTMATMARLERAVRAVSQDPSTWHVYPPQPVVVATGSSHRGESRNLLLHLFDRSHFLPHASTPTQIRVLARLNDTNDRNKGLLGAESSRC